MSALVWIWEQTGNAIQYSLGYTSEEEMEQLEHVAIIDLKAMCYWHRRLPKERWVDVPEELRDVPLDELKQWVETIYNLEA